MANFPTTNAVRRLTKDLQKLMEEPIEGIMVSPVPDNILEWHYILLGSPDTPYHGGAYHGRLIFKPDFPWRPPAIYMDTPNGRFQTGVRLCLSISDYHPETWNPGWSVGSILLGVQSFMNENSHATGVVYPTPPDAEKERLAMASQDFNKRNPVFRELFPHLLDDEEPSSSSAKSSPEQSKDNKVKKRGRETSNNSSLPDEEVVVLDDGPEQKKEKGVRGGNVRRMNGLAKNKASTQFVDLTDD